MKWLNGRGAINLNVLWEMGGAQRVLEGVLENCPGPDHRRYLRRGHALQTVRNRGTAQCPITCPSSARARAFRALWKRAYHKVPHLLGAVVYEDPWFAGGHNGLSNAEDPLNPEDPYPRVKALRDVMRAEGISDDVPIVMAGGVWYLRDWNDWIENPELGQIAFQLRHASALLTVESPIPQGWKDHFAHHQGR